MKGILEEFLQMMKIECMSMIAGHCGCCAGSGVNWEVLQPMHSLRRLTVRQGARGNSVLQDILTQMPRLHTVIYHGACIGEGYHRGTEIRYREYVWARRRRLAKAFARISAIQILGWYLMTKSPLLLHLIFFLYDVTRPADE